MPTKNGLALTRRAIDSLTAHIPPAGRSAVELIVVDGGSTDGTFEYLRQVAQRHPVKLLVTHPEEPFNFALACNRGARLAVGKYLLLVNNDVEVRSEDPWTPLRAALTDPRVGIAGTSTVWSPEQCDPEWDPECRRIASWTGRSRVTSWGRGARCTGSWGGLDEAFTGHGDDDLDIQFRARLAHYHLALASVPLYHAGHGTDVPVHGEAGMQQMAEENRRLFVRKHRRRVYALGPRVEPFASHCPPALSVLVVARDEGPRLRQTLERAARDPGCQDGRVQVVVVDNGSTDDTSLLLEEYRLRLPNGLTVITQPKPVPRTRAREIGRARASAPTVPRMLAPGDWYEAGQAAKPPATAGRNSAYPLAASGFHGKSGKAPPLGGHEDSPDEVYPEF